MRFLLICTLALLAAAANARPATAKVVTSTVAFRDGDVQLTGYLAYDDAIKGKRPGVLVIHEWWGLNDYAKKRAEMLAEMGYVAFAADMYGTGVTAKDAKEAGKLAGAIRKDRHAWMKRAKANLEILKSATPTDGTKLAAIGYCFGGSTVLNMALTGMPVNAVVSFHGALPTDVTVGEAKDCKAKILVCHGANDSFIKDEVIQKFRGVLDEGKTDYMFVYYANAVHSFTNPGADKYMMPGIAYNREADTRSWAHMRQLFHEVFGEKARTGTGASAGR